MQPLGKVLDEGAAARRTRLVERDVADAAVLDEEALHVLSADVEHKAHLGAELLCSAQVGKGLHLTAVRMECRLDNRLAVACRHSTCDVTARWHHSIEVPQCLDDRAQRRALIAAVIGVKQFLVFSNGDELRRRRSCIDADPNRTAIGRKVTALHAITIVSLLECSIIRRILKEHEVRRARFRCRSCLRTCNTRLHLPHIGCLGIIGERRADRDEIIAVIHIDDVILVKFQRLDKASFQFREKVKRSAEKGDLALNGTPLREVADGLIDHRLKDRERNIRLLCAVIHQCLNICLGKDAAARGDGIDALSLFGKCIQTDWIGRQQGCHVIDKGARTARADTVHALLRRIAEVRDLSVLAAELDCRRGIGNKSPHS